MSDRLMLAALVFVLACGGESATKPDTKQATNDKTNPEEPPPSNDVDSDAGPKADDTTPKKDPCVGFEIDLSALLMNAACEVPNPKPDDKSVDTKGKLDVTLVPSSATVSPGGHADLTLTLTNKSGGPLPLSFTLDPTPRFPTETYDAKKKRVDMPAGNPPALPKGMPAREATSHETARITLVANATAKLTIPWDAVKMKWAPDKLKGTPPESGYPRTPAGPLAKGVYSVRVVMPLVLVFEGTDREVSAPKTTITVK
jgi:hypothetical protein